MARYKEPNEEQLAGWNEWVASRPEVVKKLAEQFDPWSLYKMKSTGHLVTIASFSENNTLTVNVTAEFNAVLLHERSVFGVKPEDLEPAEVPDKPGIALMSNEDVENNIDAMRVLVRPDLWEMGQDGKAIWKGEGPSPDEQNQLH